MFSMFLQSGFQLTARAVCPFDNVKSVNRQQTRSFQCAARWRDWCMFFLPEGRLHWGEITVEDEVTYTISSLAKCLKFSAQSLNPKVTWLTSLRSGPDRVLWVKYLAFLSHALWHLWRSWWQLRDEVCSFKVMCPRSWTITCSCPVSASLHEHL